MGRIRKVYPVHNRIKRRELEATLAKHAVTQGIGSVTQQAEDRTFNPDDGGSKPSGPTINKLIAKKCQHCTNAMHIHRSGDNIVFAGCEPCIIDIRLERTGKDQMLIKGRRSTKRVRCGNCKRSHLLTSFEEIKDAVSGAGERA